MHYVRMSCHFYEEVRDISQLKVDSYNKISPDQPKKSIIVDHETEPTEVAKTHNDDSWLYFDITTMILREALKRSVLLQRRSLAGYIHMEDHDKKINPGRQQLSYNNPKYFKKDKTWINVPLGKKGRVSIEEGKFR